jgi:L-2-hydroxycarboxylate dehydrogenase (NAD+)
VLHPVDSVRRAVERLCREAGAAATEAALLADVLIEAELRGRSTHGLNRLDSVLKRLRARGPERPRVVEERGALVRIDGADESGYLAVAFAAETAARVALAEGHALVGLSRTRHCGMLGYYAGLAARRGVIALLFADCAPLMAPWGGARAVLGTNPIAAAFPAEPHPILIDLSTAAITFGALDRLRAAGRPAPEGTVLDAAGHPTTDPAAARTILPFGGPKGYALGLLVQLLAVAAGGAAVPEHYADYGVLILALRPDLFCPREQYDRNARELIARLKASAPAGGAEVLIPGERAFREREARLREGIEVPADVAPLLRLAARAERMERTP